MTVESCRGNIARGGALRLLVLASGGPAPCKRDDYEDEGDNEEDTANGSDDDDGKLVFGW